MTLQQMITDLADINLGGENDWYRWREIDDSRLPKGTILPAGSQYEKNVALKLELHRLWLLCGWDVERRLALAKYYVSTWGGIPKNEEETLRAYAMQDPGSVVQNGKKGIASWSKVLCIRDPKNYAIFDARVSTALNCLQIIGQVACPSLFPLLRGRNETINLGNRKIEEYAHQRRWGKAKDREFYTGYLDLIQNAARSCQVANTAIYTVEMLLFAQAEILLSRAFPITPAGR